MKMREKVDARYGAPQSGMLTQSKSKYRKDQENHRLLKSNRRIENASENELIIYYTNEKKKIGNCARVALQLPARFCRWISSISSNLLDV